MLPATSFLPPTPKTFSYNLEQSNCDAFPFYDKSGKISWVGAITVAFDFCTYVRSIEERREAVKNRLAAMDSSVRSILFEEFKEAVAERTAIIPPTVTVCSAYHVCCYWWLEEPVLSTSHPGRYTTVKKAQKALAELFIRGMNGNRFPSTCANRIGLKLLEVVDHNENRLSWKKVSSLANGIPVRVETGSMGLEDRIGSLDWSEKPMWKLVDIAEAIGYDKSRQIAGVLRLLGWTQDRHRTDGMRWVPPAK